MRLLLVVLAVSSCLLGAPALAQSADQRAKAKIDEHQRLTAEKKYPEALALIRAEIDRPTINEPLYRAAIRSLAISDLTVIATDERKTGLFADPAYDADMLRWYAEALALAAQNNAFQATIHTSYANYYELTGRPGSAIPARFLGMSVVEAADPTAKISQLRRIAEGSVWAGHEYVPGGFTFLFGAAVNEFMARKDTTIEKSLSVFFNEVVPAADSLVRDDPRALDSAWSPALEEACAKVGCSPSMWVPRLFFAKAYARRGDGASARRFFDTGLGFLLMNEPTKPVMVQKEFWTSCFEVMVLAAERRHADAVAMHARCRAAITALGGEEAFGANSIDRHLTFDIDLAAAESRVALGNGAAAIDLYRGIISGIERGRAGYDDIQLAAFFTSPRPRRAYEGLLRAELGNSGASIDRAELVRLLNAAELFRARQLRDMQARRAGQSRQSVAFNVITYLSAPETTGDLLAALPEDATLLYMISMDEQLIAIAVDRGGHEVRTFPIGRAELSAKIDRAVALLSRPTRQQEVESILAELSKLTVAPFAQRLAAKKTLYVVPDGELSRIPFTTLSTAAQGYRPLIESHSVIVLPALEFLRRSPGDPAGSGFLGIGDPAYPTADQVLGGARSVLTRSGAAYTQRGDAIFPPLPETRSEIEAIAARLASRGSQLLLGKDAVESKFKTLPLDNFRFVHFATHGVLGGDLPGLDEPALVLGAERGQDALLRASEVVPLKLRAEIAVLSACQTGSGAYVHGEGVLGMGRAFLVAGTRATVVSLWQVASKETETLMVAFYDKLGGGLSSAEAMRAAMLDLKARQPHPFFWAPFILMGRT